MKRTLYAVISFVLCMVMLFPLAACTGGLVVQETLPSTMQPTDTNGIQTTIPTGIATQTPIYTGSDTLGVTDSLTLPSISTQTDILTQQPSYIYTESFTSTPTYLPTEYETQAPTQGYTESMTETEMEITTESQTEAPTDPITEPVTETVTETQTEKPTEKPTEKEDPIPGKTTTTNTLKAKTYRLNQINSSFRYVGRVKTTSDGLIFDHSASTIEFQGYMTGNVELTVSSTKGETYFTVYIDGKRSSTRFKVSGANQTITIAKFTGKYFHKISVVKQTEVDWSISTLHTLKITGTLSKAPAKKDLYIEFYGDSLTAGYGNIGKPGDEPSDSAPYEDATKTYAYLLSQKLDADCSILARSGVGLAPCWSECFQDRFKKYSFNRSNDSFSFSGARVPDLVVIHLGANDYVYGSTKENFIKHGKDLINYIRNGYRKDIPIIWAHDPGEGRPGWIDEIIASFGGEANGFYTIALPWSEAGAGGHPSANEHQKHATLIYNLIKKKKILE